MQDDTCNDTITTYATYTVLVAVRVVIVISFVISADLALAIWPGVILLSKKTHTSLHSLLHGVAEVCIWLGPSHRQAKHNEKTLELMGSLTGCEDTKEM